MFLRHLIPRFFFVLRKKKEFLSIYDNPLFVTYVHGIDHFHSQSHSLYSLAISTHLAEKKSHIKAGSSDANPHRSKKITNGVTRLKGAELSIKNMTDISNSSCALVSFGPTPRQPGSNNEQTNY